LRENTAQLQSNNNLEQARIRANFLLELAKVFMELAKFAMNSSTFKLVGVAVLLYALGYLGFNTYASVRSSQG
jgi:hypothetical protein